MRNMIDMILCPPASLVVGVTSAFGRCDKLLFSIVALSVPSVVSRPLVKEWSWERGFDRFDWAHIPCLSLPPPLGKSEFWSKCLLVPSPTPVVKLECDLQVVLYLKQTHLALLSWDMPSCAKCHQLMFWSHLRYQVWAQDNTRGSRTGSRCP